MNCLRAKAARAFTGSNPPVILAASRLGPICLSSFFHNHHPACADDWTPGGTDGNVAMVDKSQPLTEAGLKKIEEELEHLETVRRREVAEKIHQAKELASTQNDAEYEDAKNEQAMLEGRIAQLQSLITNASIIDEAGAHKSKLVTLGSSVKVKTSEGKSHEYTIVGPAEADPREGKISNESPVGRALMGKKLHEEVQVSAPKGVMTMKITKIS
jgi:transcription elongation factor GreA